MPGLATIAVGAFNTLFTPADAAVDGAGGIVV